MKSLPATARTETLEDFYWHKFSWVPEIVTRHLGHFNIFDLEPIKPGAKTYIPYRRREYFKIMLVKGTGTVHYAHKSVVVHKQALSFSNPLIPYKWENLNQIQGGVYCIFNEKFMQPIGLLLRYEVFHPTGNHIFELTDEQAKSVENIFNAMKSEFASSYKYRFDRIRNLILELVHLALKMHPVTDEPSPTINASKRISIMFLELMERQFPIDENHSRIKLRTPADYARNLNVHVNHLNRALKESLHKTTSRLIADRLIQEACIMLQQSKWSIADIAYSLGFSEPSHFNNFFKKNTGTSPSNYRKNLK